MTPLPDLPSGIYRHYKGPLYFVFGYGHDANVPGRIAVAYIGLELTDAHTGPRFAFRTADDFHAKVCPLPVCENYGGQATDPYQGCIRCKSAMVPRFAYVGPSWEGA